MELQEHMGTEEDQVFTVIELWSDDILSQLEKLIKILTLSRYFQRGYKRTEQCHLKIKKFIHSFRICSFIFLHSNNDWLPRGCNLVRHENDLVRFRGKKHGLGSIK